MCSGAPIHRNGNSSSKDCLQIDRATFEGDASNVIPTLQEMREFEDPFLVFVFYSYAAHKLG